MPEPAAARPSSSSWNEHFRHRSRHHKHPTSANADYRCVRVQEAADVAADLQRLLDDAYVLIYSVGSFGTPEGQRAVVRWIDQYRRSHPANSSVEWCGAGFYTPITDETGKVCAESRRMCGLKEPHEWHQDRFDATFRWKALPPLAARYSDEVPR